VLGECAVHLNELLADGGVDGDLLPEHLYLLVRHHLDVPERLLSSGTPFHRGGGGGGGGLAPVPPLHCHQPHHAQAR
jgi:hypothetical protein